MATNKEVIEALTEKVSNLEGKFNQVIDLITDQKVNEPTFEPVKSGTKKTIISGNPEPMTVDEALRPVKPEPMLMGKVPMDRDGNITDPSWQRIKVANSEAEKYVKFKVLGTNSDGSLQLSEDVEDETDTFYVDENRRKLDEWRNTGSRKKMLEKMNSLQKINGG